MPCINESCRGYSPICHVRVYFLEDGLGLTYTREGRKIALTVPGNQANQGILARGGGQQRFGTAPYAIDLEQLWQAERGRITISEGAPLPGRPLTCSKLHRMLHCLICNTICNRDTNAAKNIYRFTKKFAAPGLSNTRDPRYTELAGQMGNWSISRI